ncbi:hypothetical protein [Pantoea sp.]|uniref:hypothetical protein n=1 Tax=Pantoea sp. TaxID=69393 RepID=UPI0028997A6C|nr:hypothetical protein [Pantoea sp.]
MKNHSYNPHVTELIRSFDGIVYGICCRTPLMQHLQENRASLNLHQRVSTPEQPINETMLIIIPLQEAELHQLILAPEQYSWLQAPSVRLAINYALLQANFSALQDIASRFRFWLYDFAPPGANWSDIEAFPFYGIAFNEDFFNDNYQKFTFPYLLESFAQRNVDLILRTAAPQLSEACYKSLFIKGWQQRSLHSLFDN